MGTVTLCPGTTVFGSNTVTPPLTYPRSNAALAIGQVVVPVFLNVTVPMWLRPTMIVSGRSMPMHWALSVAADEETEETEDEETTGAEDEEDDTGGHVICTVAIGPALLQGFTSSGSSARMPICARESAGQPDATAFTAAV